MKYVLKQALIFSLILLLAACAARAPSHPENMCAIFHEFPEWYKDTQATEDKWGVPISVQMAIMYHESAFKKEARPPAKGLIPWEHPTSAYSYAQVLDGTWDNYKHNTGHFRAKRNDFFYASDFIGWYCFQSHRKLGLDYDDAYAEYLAYHEGWNGYAKGTYKKQPWLMQYAQRVQARATLYEDQLNQCKKELDEKHLWF